MYESNKNLVGNFSPYDGTIDFYLRVNSLLKKKFTILDLGAGRAAWYDDDECETSRSIRLIKGKVHKVIAADIDKAVLNNKASDEQIFFKNGKLNVDKNSIDIVIADYVLEHVENPKVFFEQINYCLKSNGWFCARTPHKYCYVAILARIFKNSLHASILKKVQPKREEIDIFPTTYKMNTIRDIKNIFHNWDDKSFLIRSEPSYYFGSKFIFKLQSFLHRITPLFFSGSLFIFLKKP